MRTLLFFALFSNSAFAAELPFGTQPGLAPLESVIFCQKYPPECKAQKASGKESLDQLAQVNKSVNSAIKEDIDKNGQPGYDHWYLAPATGNCNDFAVTKRHELLKLGWDSSHLLLAQVLVGEAKIGHMVLIARAAKGDFVLDSINKEIVPLEKLKYKLVQVQKPEDPNFWLKVTSPVLAKKNTKTASLEETEKITNTDAK